MSVRMRCVMGAATMLAALSMGGCGCSVTAPCGGSGLIGAYDLAKFDSVPDFVDLDFSAIQPYRQFAHWQLRQDYYGNGDMRTLYGAPPGVLTSPAEQAVMDTLRFVYGFATGDCAPAWCGRHFVSITPDGAVQVWKTNEEASQFLGTIDSATEAILMGKMAGYRFDSRHRDRGAVRTLSNSYLLIGTRVLSTCDPIVTERYLLEVDRDATIQILDHETIGKDDGCYVV